MVAHPSLTSSASVPQREAKEKKEAEEKARKEVRPVAYSLTSLLHNLGDSQSCLHSFRDLDPRYELTLTLLRSL